jgi:hypothetical protein
MGTDGVSRQYRQITGLDEQPAPEPEAVVTEPETVVTEPEAVVTEPEPEPDTES